MPPWLFLHWIPQLTGMLQLEAAEPVYSLLLRIAEEYPQALYYPLRCSTEGATWERARVKPKILDFVDK